jgi:pyruvate/2-oxoglutarate/acetoin dehydrogenase E1 component
LLSIKVRAIDPETKQKKDFDIEKINISSITKKDRETLIKSLDKVLKK